MANRDDEHVLSTPSTGKVLADDFIRAVDAAGELALPGERELADKLRRQIQHVTLSDERAAALGIQSKSPEN